jgi:hypothetical protein
VKFFFDNTLSLKLVRALRELEQSHNITHLTERFLPNTPDVMWISELAQERNWIVISGDFRISRNRGERKAWRESDLVGFFLARGWGNLPLWEHAWRFLKCWQVIVSQASQARPPAAFSVQVKSPKLDRLQI